MKSNESNNENKMAQLSYKQQREQLGDNATKNQAAASIPGVNIWVGASAGTGKTKVLSDRVLRLLLSGTRPERILCLTYTKAAAKEMSRRISKKLSNWAIMEEDELESALNELTDIRLEAEDSIKRNSMARSLFAATIDTPGGMKIQTIHAFCGSILGRFPLEAGLVPNFSQIEEMEAKEIRDTARTKVLEFCHLELDSRHGKALDWLASNVSETVLARVMADVINHHEELESWLDEAGNRDIDAAFKKIDEFLGVSNIAKNPELYLTALCDDTAFDVRGLRNATEILANGTVTDKKKAEFMQPWLAMDTASRVNNIELWQRAFFTLKGELYKTMATKKSAAALPFMQEEAERQLEIMDRLKSINTAIATKHILTLGRKISKTYQESKKARGMLDFDDLIIKTERLLSGTAPDGSPAINWVMYKLDRGIEHILIDEAQDTSPKQWQLIRALAAEFFAGKGAEDEENILPERYRSLFAVGDEKQSIYSFQGAAPEFFHKNRDYFARKSAEAKRYFDDIKLEVSFRTTPAVLHLVDSVFDIKKPAYKGLGFSDNPASLQRIQHIPYRLDQAGHVELWPPVPRPEKEEIEPWFDSHLDKKLAKKAANKIIGKNQKRELAAAIADRIKSWFDDEVRLPSTDKPILAEDILILLRTRGDLFAELVRALKARKIPVSGLDRMKLTEELAIMDLLCLADFLLLPEDDLTLATLLKSPLIGLDEEELFQLCHNRKSSLWQSLKSSQNHPETVSWLTKLLSNSDKSTPYHLFASILSAPCPADNISGRRSFLKRLGADASDPLDEFLSFCLSYETSHCPSLQHFTNWIRSADIEVKREMEEGGGEVRIMTIHGAKGLESPIVFLPDTTSKPRKNSHGQPIIWPNKNISDRKNNNPPLWSANKANMPEALKKLSLSFDDNIDEEYHRLLYVALTRPRDQIYICGIEPNKKFEDSWFGLIKSAMDDDLALDEGKLLPWGEHAQIYATPQKSAAEKTEKPKYHKPVPPLPKWTSSIPMAEPEPPRPLAPSRLEDDSPVASPLEGGKKGQIFKRGILTHHLLRHLPDLPESAREDAAKHWLSSATHNLEPAQQSKILDEVMEILHYSDYARFFSDNSRAEIPITGLIGKNVLSGQIDRLYIDDKDIWIIDFKTHRPPPKTPEKVSDSHLKQLAAYKAILAAIYPAHNIHTALLWTDGAIFMEIPNILLPDIST